MQAPNKKAAPFSVHRYVFYLQSLSLISQWILRTRTFISSHRRCYGGHSASRSSRKTRRLGMRLNRVLVLRREQWTNNSYRMLCFESFVFTCLTYRNVQRFRNGPVHEFYVWKASQMSKFVLVLTKNHMLKNQESSGTEFKRYSGQQLSRQKE